MSKKSYGIALCKHDAKTAEFQILTIKKNYTYDFAEFIQNPAKYKNENKFRTLLDGMSLHEKRLLLKLDFDQIYGFVFSSRNSNFMKLKQQFYELYSNRNFPFKRLIMNSQSVEPHWEIPKGKKEKKETPLQTAVREFKHETGIDEADYIILDQTPIVYNFSAEKKSYTYYYFIAQPIADMKTNLSHKLKFSTQFSEAEISIMKFISVNDIKFLHTSKTHRERLMNLLRIMKIRFKKRKRNVQKIKELSL